MDLAVERLQSLRVADVMARRVVLVEVDLPLFKAAATFREHRINAAPVVDAAGLCVGMLSATDLLRHMAEPRATEPIPRARDYMTSAVQSVAPEMPILLAARIMCVQHVHRLVVLDQLGKPIGVISSMDIIAALGNAMDEMNIVSA